MTISPFNTLQEQQIGKQHAPWRMLVCCTLLNQTHGRQVRPIIDEFFHRWPSPQGVVNSTDGMYDLIRSLGFGNRRIETLTKLCESYVKLFADGDPPPEEGYEWVDAIFGCGQYAKDSIAIFHCDVLINTSSDTWLQKYVDWRRGESKDEPTSPAHQVPVNPARE